MWCWSIFRRTPAVSLGWPRKEPMNQSKPSRASRRTAPLCSALPGQNKNPLFIEFYPHTKCDCYKINLPWTMYRCHTLVLCDAAKGLAHAKRLARRAIAEHLEASLAEPMPNSTICVNQNQGQSE